MDLTRRRAALLLASAALAGCGGGAPRPAIARAGTGRAAVNPPRFGDADPVAWPGRAPSAYPVHGIDAARFQGAIDWPTAQRNGVSFAFLKGTEGGDRVDAMFHSYWRGAAEAGIPRGAYHFFYWCRPALEQARWFIANIPRERGSLPHALDLEWNPQSPTCATYRPPPEVVRSEAQVFLDALERHYGQRPVIYTDPGFFERNELMRFAGEEVWLRATAGHPTDVYGVGGWTFWQYSGTGLVPGVERPVDLNAFGGSEGDWLAWLGARTV